MARRPGGKAASRKARQRYQPRAPRPALPQEAAPAPEAASPSPLAAGQPREAVSLDPPRRVTPTRAAAAGSSLTARERADYHYVERDLRNIGILTAVIAALLLVAWFTFTAFGLVS